MVAPNRNGPNFVLNPFVVQWQLSALTNSVSSSAPDPISEPDPKNATNKQDTKVVAPNDILCATDSGNMFFVSQRAYKSNSATGANVLDSIVSPDTRKFYAVYPQEGKNVMNHQAISFVNT